jgi:hypothetical protein
MNYFARSAFTALTIALIASADTTPKRSADPNTTITPSSRSTLGFSPWRAIYLQRNGTVDWRKRKDFNDLRFEYRWKSESSAVGDVCTVEIRPSEDFPVSDTIPKITIVYIDPLSHGHVHPYIGQNVPASQVSHAYLRPLNCERIDFVYWSK